MRLILLSLSLLLVSNLAGAEETKIDSSWVEGSEFEIIASYETKSERDGASGSSQGSNAYLETVIVVEADGILREFDIKRESDEEPQLIDWKFPAQIWDRAGQEPSLANRTELEDRRDTWLAAAKLPREACGKHYFTWNVFKVECDPDEVLAMFGELDLTKAVSQDGALIVYPGASSSANLKQIPDNNGLETFLAEFEVDPNHVRAARAEAAVIVAEILGKPIELADAQAEQANINYSGTITVRFEISRDRNLMRRIVESSLIIVGIEGGTETEYSKQTVERKRAGN